MMVQDVVSVSTSRSRDGLETYQRLVSVSSRKKIVNVSVSSLSRAFTSRAHPCWWCPHDGSGDDDDEDHRSDSLCLLAKEMESSQSSMANKEQQSVSGMGAIAFTLAAAGVIQVTASVYLGVHYQYVITIPFTDVECFVFLGFYLMFQGIFDIVFAIITGLTQLDCLFRHLHTLRYCHRLCTVGTCRGYNCVNEMGSDKTCTNDCSGFSVPRCRC